MKCYLAGPMTGYPQFNFPLFAKVAKALREDGIEVISPAETDSKEVQEAAITSSDGKLDEKGEIAGETWGDMLAADVKLIADVVDSIVLLPKWEQSKGARLEAFVAVTCGHPLFEYTYSITNDFVGGIEPVTNKYILERINASLL